MNQKIEKKTDYTIESITKKIKQRYLRLDYADFLTQKENIWNIKQKCLFIDSIMKDYPIPPIYIGVTNDDLAEPNIECRHIIDGMQRLMAIYDYMEDRFKVPVMTDSFRITEKYYSELDDASKEKLNSFQISVIELFYYNKTQLKELQEHLNGMINEEDTK